MISVPWQTPAVNQNAAFFAESWPRRAENTPADRENRPAAPGSRGGPRGGACRKAISESGRLAFLLLRPNTCKAGELRRFCLAWVLLRGGLFFGFLFFFFHSVAQNWQENVCGIGRKMFAVNWRTQKIAPCCSPARATTILSPLRYRIKALMRIITIEAARTTSRIYTISWRFSLFTPPEFLRFRWLPVPDGFQAYSLHVRSIRLHRSRLRKW